MKGKKQSKKKKNESDVNPQSPAAAAADILDVIMLPNRDMATQTPENIETGILEGEEDFQRNKIDKVRAKFVVDEIKAEDFDNDYENGNQEENVISPDAVIRPSVPMEEDKSESEGPRCSIHLKKSKGDIEKEQVDSQYENAKKEENVHSRDAVKRASDTVEGDKNKSEDNKVPNVEKKSKEKI